MSRSLLEKKEIKKNSKEKDYKILHAFDIPKENSKKGYQFSRTGQKPLRFIIKL